MQDIFFMESYGKLYEEIEGGTCETFVFSHPLGTVRYLFIRRPVPAMTGRQMFYDITTPYGYGGPFIERTEEGAESQLIHLFDQEFDHYCKEHRIICEFIRFHPLIGNARHFSDIYDVRLRRKTTGTNLERYMHPETEEFSKSSRRNIRKAFQAGVSFRVTENPSSLNEFTSIYYETMKRNRAESIYYFSDKYFAECLSSLGENIVFAEVFYEGRVIGASISFSTEKWIHSHLSGTLSEYNHLSPAYVLQYALVLWGKQNGKQLIHDGGGRTAAPDDPLYLFKKQFGRHTEFNYHVGQKIRNEAVYRDICNYTGTAETREFFPAYRSLPKSRSAEKVPPT